MVLTFVSRVELIESDTRVQEGLERWRSPNVLGHLALRGRGSWEQSPEP
jgi:hypothetical protein